MELELIMKEKERLIQKRVVMNQKIKTLNKIITLYKRKNKIDEQICQL